MIRLSFLLLIIYSFAACSSPVDLSVPFNQADSIAINFFAGDGTPDSVHRVVLIRDKETIASLSAFVSASNSQKLCGGNDGNLNIFAMNQVIQKIDFSFYNQSCMQFSFWYNQQLHHTRLSKEAREFLLELKNRKP